MITVITEHTNLLTAKAAMQAARNAPGANTLNPSTIGVAEAVNRALGDTTAALRAAVDGLIMGDFRLAARVALTELEQDITELAHIDAFLWAAALLPADVDADYDLARLRAHREAITTSITENTATLVIALGDVRLDLKGDE